MATAQRQIAVQIANAIALTRAAAAPAKTQAPALLTAATPISRKIPAVQAVFAAQVPAKPRFAAKIQIAMIPMPAQLIPAYQAILAKPTASTKHKLAASATMDAALQAAAF